jgi:hypothetical protein
MAPADDLTPALVAAGAWLAFGAALDVVLVHEGHRPITHALRTPAGSAFLAVLCLHVADVLGPLDPFRRVAGCIPRRSRTAPDFVTNGIRVPRRRIAPIPDRVIGSRIARKNGTVVPFATASCPCPRPGECR